MEEQIREGTTMAESEKPKAGFTSKKIKGREALLEEIESYKAEAQELPFEQAELKGAHERRIALAEKRVRVFEARHDNTGALKGQYLGQELHARFDEMGARLGEDLNFERDPKLEDTQLIFVSLGELDRINAEGDHHSGDLALQALHEKIEETLQDELKDMGEAMTEKYGVFRSGGSKFSVKLAGVPKAVAERIRQQLDTALDISSILPGREPAPLAASRIGEDELIDVFEELPAEEKLAFAQDKRHARMMIGTAFEMLNQLNDKRETESRIDRLIEKIKTGDEAEAAAFYENYQARALTPIFSEDPDTLLSYADVKAKLQELGALEDGAWADRKAEIAGKEARRQFEARRLTQRDTERKISEIAAKTYIDFQGGIAESKARYEKQAESTFKMPEPTEGKKEIRRLADMRGQLTEKLKDKQCPEKGSLDPECQDLEEVGLDLELAEAERDSMTGLKERGPLFHAIENSLEKGESVSTVYIDMAFLKYFDKEGGRDTGNIAIEKAGEILDTISVKFKEAGKQVEAYRIGGDEFAFSVSGEDEAFLKDLINDLMEAQKSAGKVPLQGEAPVGVYADQSLSFNFGVYHAKDKDSMKAFLKENEIALEHEGSQLENNELAEYMLRFADKQLEIQKGINRLQLLLHERETTADPESGTYAQLEKYSKKAIFGKAGATKIEEWHERIAKAKTPDERLEEMASIDSEMTAFVLEQIKEKNEKAIKQEGSIDKIIGEHVRDKFLEQKIESMQAALESLQAELAAARSQNQELLAENESLVKRIALLEQEKEQITELRERIRG
jgi:GGDEF domain-containing protein